MKFFVGEQKISYFLSILCPKTPFFTSVEVLGRELIPQGTPVK